MEGDGAPGRTEIRSLRDHLQVLRRRKWLVLQAVLIVPTLAVLLALRQDAVYQASSEVLLNTQNLALSLTGTSDPLTTRTPERVAETQAQLARVPEVAKRVLERAGVRDRTPEDFLAASAVVPRTNADLLVLTVNDGDPELASRLASIYAREYTKYRSVLDTASFTRARLEVEREIARLERRNERDSALFASLVEKQQQLRTIEALQTANASVVRDTDQAYKISPRPKRSAILGLVLGTILGLGLAFLREALDTRVRTTEEIERVLGMPLLARIPAPRRELQRANRLVMVAHPSSSEAETYRILRTNFDFFNLDAGARTVMVTSAVSEEGKSTTIANLALALARAGQRVALVDLDLRRPILDRFFRFRGRPGVTDVALGHAKLAPVDLGPTRDEQAGKRLGQKGSRQKGSLEVLTAGTLRTTIGDLVASDQLGDVLDELRDRADIVLVDAPPILLVGDAMQLSPQVDAIIVVTRLGFVRRQMIADLRRALDASPALKLGFVVTGAELEHDYRYAYASYAYHSRSAGKTSR